MGVQTCEGERGHRRHMMDRVAPGKPCFEPARLGLERLRVALEREDPEGVDVDPLGGDLFNRGERGAGNGDPHH